MAKINLPKEILEKESFKTLPAKGKEEYMGNLLKKVLDLNPEGITISQIKEATGFTYSTIWHHLEILSCTAQGKKISHGNVDVYFPAGDSSHLNVYTQGKIQYAISLVENNEGSFVCMHEKRENRLGNQTICKGISIPVEMVDDVIKELKKLKKKAKKSKK